MKLVTAARDRAGWSRRVNGPILSGRTYNEEDRGKNTALQHWRGGQMGGDQVDQKNMEGDG